MRYWSYYLSQRAKRPKNLSIAVLLFTLFYHSGCSTSKETVDIDHSIASTEIVAMVNALPSSLQTFSAEGIINIDSPRLTQSAGFQLAVKKPDSVRIIVEGPFGITMGRALLTKEHYIAYNALQNSVYEGNIKSGARMFRWLDIPPSVIVDVLTGIRRFDNDQMTPDSFSVSGENYVLQFINSTGLKKFTINSRSMRITRVETFDTETRSLLWSEQYDYRQNNTGMWEPTTVTVIVPEKELFVEIVFDTVVFNPALNGLSISYPNDAERITAK